jgi:hypothetical protein
MIWTRLYHEPNEECFHLKSLAEFYESVHLDRKLSTGHLLKEAQREDLPQHCPGQMVKSA